MAQPSTKRLQLTTLGQFTIRLDGKPVKGLASRKAEALLFYLACTNQVHAREHLATLLWDDRPLGRSLGNLSVIVNSLKKKLDSFLDIERSSIGLKAGGRIWMDLIEVRVAIEGVRTADQAGNRIPPAHRKAAEEALLLYRGPFLQGFHMREARGFDEWISLEAERIQRQVLEGWRLLSDAHLTSGDVAASYRCLRNAIEIDPLHEELHRKLMRGLALSGRYEEAIAQYRACAEVLDTDLNVEPSLETRRLFDRILDRRERPDDNLPSLADATVGREEEIEEISTWLLASEARLLTLAGTGGIGKTRLAVEASSRLRGAFLEGVWFVDLAPLEQPDQVVQVIGRELSIPEGPPTSASVDSDMYSIDRLVSFMRGKEMLLVLDNCEHLLDACGPVAQHLLRQCPGLKILATSRARFDIPEEHLFTVEPLSVPDEQAEADVNLQVLRENDSIRLFANRARAVRKPFRLNEQNAALLVRICQMLDGMPLAIELTASRLHALSLIQIKKNLEQSIDLLRRDHKAAIPRHQTLEAALDWSYCLLNEQEQALFRLATIFRGGFDLAAFVALAQELGFDLGSAEQILAQLVEKSLVVAREIDTDCNRYSLLEPVRQFGLQRMTQDPVHEHAQEAHAAYYFQMAQDHGPRLHGRERKQHLRKLEPDAGNLQKSLRHFLDQSRPDICLQFAHAVWEGYWLNQGYFSEGRDWIDQVLEITDHGMGFLYGSSRLARGAFAWTLGNNTEALVHIDQALEHARRIDDAHLTQWSLYWKAFVIFDQTEFSEAAELLEEAHAIATNAGIRRGAAWSVFYLAQIARVRGQTEYAIRLYKDALNILSDLDIFGAGWCYTYLGHLALEQQNLVLAREYLDKSMQIFRDLENDRGLGGAERGMGILELEAGNIEDAEEHLRRSRRYFDKLGWIKMSSSSLIYLGYVATLTGRVEEAADLLLESLGHQYREHDWHMVAHVLYIFGLLSIRRQAHSIGLDLIRAADAMRIELSVAFPRHLLQAVERAKQDLRVHKSYNECQLPWEEYVLRILGDHEDWLESLREE
ncbi:MAG: BTAD domain-containing putative transcriptional regulator [Anaerolineales bacterium]|jgi:predicted ATPase/DNA-binding SARP family transcriptional activator